MSDGPVPRRAWQRMLSGRRLDLLHPAPADVAIEDLAHGLARVARWNGQTRGGNVFSVAQHSVLVERIADALDPDAPATDRLATLLHDAPEYVIGDMISPFKAVLGEGYKAIERRLLDAIHLRFALPVSRPTLVARIKVADRLAAFFEATQLAGFSHEEAGAVFGPPPGLDRVEPPTLAPLSPAEAEADFLARFAALQTLRGED